MLYFRILYCRIENCVAAIGAMRFCAQLRLRIFIFGGVFKMKKIVTLLLAFILVLSFVGCGKEEVEEKPGNYENESVLNSETHKKDETNMSDFDKGTNVLFEEIYAEFEEEINNTVTEMYENLEELDEELNSYRKYIENTDKVESFYLNIYRNTKSLCIKMYEYSVIYAENILESEKSNDDKYKDFEVIYDNIYDDAGDEIYDLIYDDLFDDMYDLFYDGLLDEAYDNEEYNEYSEWSDARSNEYDMWSDTRSDVYDIWSDTRSDIYDFWSDLRGELWDDDIDRAYKKIEDFKEDIEKLKTDIDDSDMLENSDESKITSSVSEEKTEESNDEYIEGMHIEFKEAMDSYEAFFDEYCEFMKKYKENPTDLSLLADYAEYMAKYIDVMAKLEKMGEEELNDAELLYYIEVNNRISQKLLEVAY